MAAAAQREKILDALMRRVVETFDLAKYSLTAVLLLEAPTEGLPFDLLHSTAFVPLHTMEVDHSE